MKSIPKIMNLNTETKTKENANFVFNNLNQLIINSGSLKDTEYEFFENMNRDNTTLLVLSDNIDKYVIIDSTLPGFKRLKLNIKNDTNNVLNILPIDISNFLTGLNRNYENIVILLDVPDKQSKCLFTNLLIEIVTKLLEQNFLKSTIVVNKIPSFKETESYNLENYFTQEVLKSVLTTKINNNGKLFVDDVISYVFRDVTKDTSVNIGPKKESVSLNDPYQEINTLEKIEALTKRLTNVEHYINKAFEEISALRVSAPRPLGPSGFGGISLYNNLEHQFVSPGMSRSVTPTPYRNTETECDNGDFNKSFKTPNTVSKHIWVYVNYNDPNSVFNTNVLNRCYQQGYVAPYDKFTIDRPSVADMDILKINLHIDTDFFLNPTKMLGMFKCLENTIKSTNHFDASGMLSASVIDPVDIVFMQKLIGFDAEKYIDGVLVNTLKTIPLFNKTVLKIN